MSTETLDTLVTKGALELSDGYRTKQSELGRPGVPILRVAEVLDGTIAPSYKDHVSEELRRAFQRKTTNPDDVVLTTKGTVGRVARVGRELPEFVYSPQLCFFRVVDRQRLDPGWLYNWFKGNEFRTQALRVQDQTDMAAYINLVDLRRMHITVPPVIEQRAIAEVLGALDDKTENADQIGDLASDLAIATGVFALAGTVGQPVYLSAQADLIKGVSYRSEDLAEGNGHLVSLKCVGRNGRFRLDGLKPFSGDCRPTQVVGQGDVLVAQTDLTQKAEVIGRPVRLPNLDTRGRLVASLDLVIARPHAPLTREFLVALLSTQEFRDHAMSYCNGTTVLHMGSRALPDFQFIMPNPSITEKITNVMRPLFALADVARSESATLTQLRDSLLPRLLSGELRVRDAEAAVEGAV